MITLGQTQQRGDLLVQQVTGNRPQRSRVEAERSPHSLMAWWAVLHTFSMLARYQPAEWAAHINVDTSQHAVDIERLLKRSIRIVPQLVAETIDQVAR